MAPCPFNATPLHTHPLSLIWVKSKIMAPKRDKMAQI